MIPPHHELCLQITGAVSVERPGEPGVFDRKVYQRTRRGAGNIRSRGTRSFQLRDYVYSNPGNTPRQLAGRVRFAEAVAAYQALTPEEREPWIKRAKGAHMSHYNLFLRHYARTHPLENYL